MASTITVAAAQIRPVLFSLEGSLERVLAAMAEAAGSGVELIVFPETFLPYYPYFSFVEPAVLMGRSHLQLYEQAVQLPGPVLDAIAAAASAMAASTRATEPSRLKSTGRIWAAATVIVAGIQRVQVSRMKAPSLRCRSTMSSTSRGLTGMIPGIRAPSPWPYRACRAKRQA